MSPKGVTTFLVWLLCLGVLFGGLFAWGRYVDARDQHRRASQALTLQRGDLPPQYRITRQDAPRTGALGTLLAASGAARWELIRVTHTASPAFAAECLYLHYPSAAKATEGARAWTRTLGSVESRTAGPIVLLIFGPPAPQGHHQAVVTAAEARLGAWAGRNGK